ncbi:secreted periplasmic zn-dependent insulinase-like peptidase, partial [Vairimorpha ceranae]
VCTLYIDFIFNNQDESRYHLVYLQIEKKLISEKFAQSYKRLFRKLKSLYIPGYQMPEELLDGIKSQEILNVKQFNYKLYIIGNIEVNEGLKVEEALKRHRQQVNASEPQSNNKISKVVTVRTFDISNNACGIFYYLNKSCDLRMKAIGSFIVNSVEEMFFDQLRTKEEFGYVVSAGIYTIKDDDFLYFVVQSDRNVEEIKERILRFITFTKDYIKNMSEQEFLERQESLIDLFKEKYKNLYGYSFFLYSKYISGIDGLTFINDICNVIKKMELKDVLNCDIFSNEIIITTEK